MSEVGEIAEAELIRTLSHKVGGEALLKELGVFKWVVQLSIGHAAALKPAVKDLVHASQLALPLPAGNGHVVDQVPVQICHLRQSKTVLTTMTMIAGGLKPCPE